MLRSAFFNQLIALHSQHLLTCSQTCCEIEWLAILITKTRIHLTTAAHALAHLNPMTLAEMVSLSMSPLLVAEAQRADPSPSVPTGATKRALPPSAVAAVNNSDPAQAGNRPATYGCGAVSQPRDTTLLYVCCSAAYAFHCTPSRLSVSCTHLC